MREFWVGTSGYTYKEWKGIFYPAKLPDEEMLRAYAERLPAVEINNPFYRLPKAAVLESWAEQVPDGFRFVLKASRRITHIKRLRDVAEETAYLYQTAFSLGPHMGVVLFQMPPNFQKDLPRLQAFLDLIPSGRAPLWNSAIPRGSGTTAPRACGPDIARCAWPTRTRDRSRPSSAQRTGATFACAAITTPRRLSPLWPSRYARNPGTAPMCSSRMRETAAGRG